jgi:hypothetical protein
MSKLYQDGKLKTNNAYKLPFNAECMSRILAGLGYMGCKEAALMHIEDGTEHLLHTHYTLDDATEQAYKYLRLLQFMRD